MTKGFDLKTVAILVTIVIVGGLLTAYVQKELDKKSAPAV